MPSHSAIHNFLQFTWENSAFYRNLYRRHGIRQADLAQISLQDLPIVTKQMVQDNYDEIVTDPRICAADMEKWLEHDNDPRSRFLGEFLVLHTSGTSGTHANMVYDEIAWRKTTAVALAYLYPGKFPGGSRYRNAFFIGDLGHVASATTALNSSREAFDCLLVSMKDPLEEIIAQLNAFQPDRLTSYSSSLGWLAGLALEGKLSIAPRDVVVSSDSMSPAIEGRIRQAWRSNIYDLYAAAESLFIAIKQPGQAEWKVLEELQTLEVLDAQDRQVGTGQVGRAVLTNWTNRTMPLIRYDLADYVICGETRPGSRSLRGFAGRSFDNLPIRLADGRAGEIPSYALANFAAAGPDALQFVSRSPDEVEVQYCSPEDMDEVLGSGMAGLLADWGGAQTKFTTRRVDHIWNDALSLKAKLVRNPDDPQIGLLSNVLAPGPVREPAGQLHPGGGFVPWGRELLEDSLSAVFERQAAHRPDATAVKDGENCLTYAGLNRAANQVAQALLAGQMDPAHPVALLFSHNAAMVTAMLGVLKAGGWYVPLDPAHPLARNTAILKEIEAGLVLTDDENLAIAWAYGFKNAQIINLAGFDGTVDSPNLGLPILPGAPACILYTSGSTGQPKGVVIDQRAVLHRALRYTNDYAIGPDDHMALLQSYVFNASVREIYAALLNGAGLYLYSFKRYGVHPLAAWLQKEAISMFHMVPSVFRVFLETLQGERFDHLRLIRLGGESVLARDVLGFQRHFGPGCLLANGLASTETGTICQDFIDHHTRVAGGRIPVGFAVQDKLVSLLDENDRPVEDGAIGEIVVVSAYFGPGYFSPAGPASDGAHPVERLVHTGDLGFRLPDGRIVLVGRKDWQVKLRGQRMNLLEIEQALLSLENVAEAAVTLQAGEEGEAFLVAYIQPGAQPAPAENDLRRALRTRLPEVMIPAIFLFFDQLPRTTGGKVDRPALPAVERSLASNRSSAVRPVPDPPGAPAQQALVAIWQELLGTERVGVSDDFFELGGHSLLAAQLLARIQEEFGQSLPLAVLLENNTIDKLAALIAGGSTTQRKSLVAIRPQGTKKPIFLLPGGYGDVLYFRNLIKYVEADRPLYGLQAPSEESGRSYGMEMKEIVSAYLTEILQLQPEGPYYLAGHSFGGYVAMEMARQLLEQGRKVAFLGLWDTYPPGPGRQANLPDRIMIHLDNLRGLGPRRVFGYFKDRLTTLLIRATHFAPVRSFLKWIHYSPKTAFVAALISSYGFQPDPYPGDIFLFEVRERPWYVRWDPMENWHKYVQGELEICEVLGQHNNILFEPYVQDLAQKLNDCLQQVDARQAKILP
jgi:amino acid adenylation domain-containing protein